MALMSEERRKEMEEEMNRFELEIAAPGAKPSSGDLLIGSKPLSPPPAPPAVSVLIPEVLAKAPPPPPPPSSSPPLHAVLRPPPPPPPVIQARSQAGRIPFIPPQLQRQPPRPPMRHSFIPMRSIHIEPHPGPFHSPGMMGPFVPPMGQAPIPGPQIGPPMHPMGPGHMQMMPGPMPMPPQMGNMNITLPMPPGFCPPTGPAPTMMHGGIPCDAQPFMPNEGAQDFVATSTAASTSEPSSVVVAAPAIYASPFVKSHAENSLETPVSANGQENLNISSTTVANTTKQERHSTKNEEHVVGPTVPSVTNNEEVVVSSKKKEKKKKIVRMAGGQAWEDNSLMEWDPDDFRIFCGDLGNDVTDEVLIRAFSKYTSFVKAKVIRDKRTNKTKGYGFVSFKDPQDFIKAMREMNGKYVGSRPIKLRKSTWRDRNIDIVKKKQKEKEKLGLL